MAGLLIVSLTLVPAFVNLNYFLNTYGIPTRFEMSCTLRTSLMLLWCCYHSTYRSTTVALP
jgi:hypothetical protein